MRLITDHIPFANELLAVDSRDIRPDGEFCRPRAYVRPQTGELARLGLAAWRIWYCILFVVGALWFFIGAAALASVLLIYVYIWVIEPMLEKRKERAARRDEDRQRLAAQEQVLVPGAYDLWVASRR